VKRLHYVEVSIAAIAVVLVGWQRMILSVLGDAPSGSLPEGVPIPDSAADVP
jgi:hypothetical protein